MNAKLVMRRQTAWFLENAQRDNRQILVVDDDHDSLKFLSDLIVKLGFKAVIADSGIEGLHGFVNGDFDLVFTDCKMILKDGFSLAYHVKARSPETPVVMLVGRNKPDPADKNEGCCIDYLLFKPFAFKDIQFAIRKFFGTWLNKKHMDSIINEPRAVCLC
jgi:two-component system, NarL family, sensor histidine kinase EvgS